MTGLDTNAEKIIFHYPMPKLLRNLCRDSAEKKNNKINVKTYAAMKATEL